MIDRDDLYKWIMNLIITVKIKRKMDFQTCCGKTYVHDPNGLFGSVPLTLIRWCPQTYMDCQPGLGGPGPWFLSVLNF